MADNIFNKLYSGSGAGRLGSSPGTRYLNEESQWPMGDSGYDSFEPGSEKVPSAREFARTFDPRSNEDVFKMQGMLGLKEDGILGPKTLAALRGLQGAPVEGEGDSGYDSYGDAGKQSIWDRVKGWASSQEGTDRSSAGGRGYGPDAGPRFSIPKEGGLLSKLGILPSGSYNSEKSSDY